MGADYKISLKAEREIAFDSPDHLVPHGTKQDNSRNPLFNRRLYALYGFKTPSVLDLGCSGGGFVKDCIDNGCLAVGLEGSDYSKKRGRAEWATIPQYLFTCDVAHDFQLFIDDSTGTRPLKFDVVTMWEVIEHISEKDLPALCKNVQKHLKPGGLWIMSVTSTSTAAVEEVEHHQTMKGKEWWIKTLSGNGFVYAPEHIKHFQTQWVRGKKIPSPTQFNLVFTNSKADAPKIPKTGAYELIFNHWVGFMPQRMLRKWLVGEV